MHRTATLLLVALLVGCASSPRVNVIPSGETFHHKYTGLEFPLAIGGYVRNSVNSYDPDSVNVSGNYNTRFPNYALATIYHYPATEDGSPPSRETITKHFEQVRDDLTQARSDSTLRAASPIEHEINGFTLSGGMAEYDVPSFKGFDGPVRSSIYLFAIGGWYLKYRFTHSPSSADFIVPLQNEFMTLTRWPAPE